MSASHAHSKSILLVAMLDSVHTARWVKQLMGQGWKIYLFPSTNTRKLHPDLIDTGDLQPYLIEADEPHPALAFLVRIVRSLLRRIKDSLSALGLRFIVELVDWPNRQLEKYLNNKFPSDLETQLKNAILRLRPNLIHSLEIQAAGYLTLDVKKKYQGNFPPWIVTNWGSDIYLFGRLRQHKDRIRDVLAHSDYYSCECERDIKLALEFGFNKTVLPVFPNTGGFELKQIEITRQEIPTSSRKIIMLKGYQHWAGRALVGLRALERCEDILGEFTIVIYSAPAEVELAAELFTLKTGIPTRIIATGTSHQEMLSLHAQARISIGLSISDAISTSLLEAMVMGSFPIQSCTACAAEWVQHGVSGMIVPPDDPDVIEMAIRTALTADGLVDKASALNWQVALTRLDGTLLKQKTVDMYRSILG